MTNVIDLGQRENLARAAIQDEASSWLVRLDGGGTAAAELEEFHAWLDRSPYHREAFRRSVAAWRDLDQLSRVLDGKDSHPSRRRASPGGGFFPRPGIATLAIIVSLTAFFLFQTYLGGGDSRDYAAAYSTGIGETRSIGLPDASRIRMNTDSGLDILYKSEARIVHLTKGEAWFSVSPDPARPFIVYAGRVAVRAVGTAFSVYVKENKLDLTVTEGRIEVATLKAVPGESLPGPEILRTAVYRVPVVAGQNMVLDDDFEVNEDKIELVQEIAPEQIEKRLSWRDGILMFDNDTLQEVVREINRYSAEKIVISDPEIDGIRFGGYFQASDISTILATLEQNYGIAVERPDTGLILLSRPAGRP